jgi:hypothetical protein
MHVSLMLLALYIVTAFAFFLSYGSYFTMLLPTLLFLVVSLAPPAAGVPQDVDAISRAS